MIGNLLNIFMWHDFNILMIFGIHFIYSFDPYSVLFYTCAAYDCVCAHISKLSRI